MAARLQAHAARSPAFATDYAALQLQTRTALSELAGLLFGNAGKRPPMTLDDLADLFVALIHGLVLQQVRDPGAAAMLVLKGLLAMAEPA